LFSFQEEIETIQGEDEEKPRHKDLTEYLGTQNTRFHPYSITDRAACTYEDSMNLSDYYGVPLVESNKSFRFKLSRPIRDASSSTSDLTLHDETKVYFQISGRDLIPSHSLILYLHGKTFKPEEITQMLSPISNKWLFENNNRLYKGLRVPQHSDFTEDMVNKIACTFIREVDYWEFDGARDESGLLYPQDWKLLKHRKRENELRRLVEKVVENYFWSMFNNGDVLHLDLAA